ncbi:MAG: hypothetical protein NWQ28_09120 [Nodularia sp. (in: cyanobacteria)]|nr:hypothetical protein [Nodularia sp. (in: cyanobacteria)]
MTKFPPGVRLDIDHESGKSNAMTQFQFVSLMYLKKEYHLRPSVSQREV